MKFPFNRRSSVETELIANRPEPPARLVREISAQVLGPRSRVRPRARLGYVGALAAAMLVIVGATGNLSYAASSISHAASSVSHATRDLFGSSGKQAAQADIGAACSQYAVAPQVSRTSPTSGKTAATVQIIGTNFGGNSRVTSVKFSLGIAASFTVNTAGTMITTHVPNGARTGPITVTNCKGHANSPAFRVIPVVSSFSPTAGKSGASILINGTGFVKNLTSVKFNGAASASVTFISYKQIRAVVPPKAAGTGRITVTTAGGTATSAAAFKIIPTITTFGPSSGKAGTVVTINGTGFVNRATTVKFGGVTVPASKVTFVSVNRIRAVVQANSKTGRITATTSGGMATSASNFTFIKPAPKITSFSPTRGKVGTLVTIHGSNFKGATSVKFGRVAAKFTVVSNTKITTHVAKGAKSGTIRVTTPSGTGSSSATSSPTFQVKP